ncbi:MAG: hypothetical protein AMJ65_09955 [Phycisphaerae bacterium SG8_4]|nr:MAG: hypothetical protein AMJ65_09955 [Phycisphaerae bacterium SG8_4]
MEDRLIRFENRLKEQSADIRPRRRFTGLINGLSLEMPRGVASRVRSMPDVLAIVPNRRYNYSLTRSNDLMNAPTAWQLTGGEELAGRGIKIGIIDTGIDHTHVMFEDQGYQRPEGYPLGDTDFTNNKIIVARVFTKGGDSAIDSTPRDRNGHGTHVASCAAGNFNTPSPLGSMSGFAPNAYLGNYKVFTGEFTTLEQIIAALEACVEDGMDVVNLSLGSEDYINSLLDPEALAIRNAIRAGVVVVAAAGNSGRPETIGSPGQIPEVITVGSLTNGHTGTSSGELDIAMMNVYSDGKQILTDEQVVLGPDPEFFSCPLLGRFQIVDADLLDGGRYGGDQHGLACVSLPAGSAQDKWVLVQRGSCTFTEKIFNVEDAGGWGALIYNNAGAEEEPDELIRGPLVPGTMLPSYFSSRNVGLTVKEALTDGGVVEVEFYAPTPFERNQTPLELSTFSSAGPSLSYVIKPEISAIGEGSYAATQNDLPGEFKFNSIDYTSFDLSGFGFSSGTSFSSPRVAGVAALIKQANPSWKPEDIKSAIVISAQRPPGFTSLSGMERGAGHVDPVRAMDLPLIVTPATLSWENVLIDEVTEARKSFRLKNVSQQFQSVSLALELPIEGCLQAIEMFPDQVDLAPSESIEVSINLTFSPPAELGQTEDISGDVILEINGESNPLRVPVWARIMNAPPAQGAILLIDDDSGESIETQYVNAVNRAGYELTLWDVAQLEAYPSVLYMQKFQAVSWFLATTSLYNITDNMLEVNERTRFNVALTKYLARGGRLLVSGQDWSDDQEQTLFAQQVLHISEFTHDPFVQYTPIGDVDDFEETLVISGVLDSPITQGISSLSADFNDTFVNMTDLLVVDETGIAKPALTANQNPLDVIGITVETDSYRAAFFSFGLERIDPGGRTRDGMETIVRNSLDWLMGGSSTRLAIRSVKPRVQIDNTVALKVTLTAEGVNFPVGHDVRLNERSVEINSIDMTGNLEILIPAGLPRGLYDITLSSPDGQTTTLFQAFEVQEPT